MSSLSAGYREIAGMPRSLLQGGEVAREFQKRRGVGLNVVVSGNLFNWVETFDRE